MKKSLQVLKNKYFIALTFFISWLMFFDTNDFFTQYDMRQTLKGLRNDHQYYFDEIRKNKEAMHELKTNPENLEKFAREKYMMKKDNEDLFVVVKKN
jgi:cell division protein FtsB